MYIYVQVKWAQYFFERTPGRLGELSQIALDVRRLNLIKRKKKVSTHAAIARTTDTGQVVKRTACHNTYFILFLGGALGKILPRLGGDIIVVNTRSAVAPEVNCSYSAALSACPRAHVGMAFSTPSYQVNKCC